MAYTVITRPADLSLSGNIADFVLDSNAPVTFKLAIGSKVILDEIYTPTSAGAITIKLRKVIEQQLTLSIPTSNFFEQTGAVIDFIATIDTNVYGIRVVKGGVDANVLDATTYLSQNFLTWQPQSKPVKLNDPEWLTYFSDIFAKKTVKARGYYLDNTTETIVAYTIDEEPKCWTMNVQYALLAGKFTAAPSYIDVWVEDSNGVRLTFIQRYILNADFDEFDDLFVFENSLGGIDTIRFTGTLQEINEPDVASAIFGEETMEYGLDVDRYFSKNTGGFKSERHQQWAVDFFNSYNRYRIADGVVRRIVLRKTDIKGVKRDVNSFSFNFAYTKQTNRLNLARFDTLPDVIEMVDPNSELFFLAPRLSEFPTAPLAYNFLFPIQSPYEKKWYKASIYEIADLLTTEGGVGQNALNSEKWDGHRWDDYMEQALKKASDVEFHNAKVNNLQAADTVINSLVSALYQSGFNGKGFKIDADGNAEVKTLMVRDQLTVLELIVQKLRSICGMIILSSANGKATKVELKENTYYRITLDTTGTLTHSFVVDDLVKCQRFNGGVKSYWRRVIAIGTDYIDLTKDSGDGTGIPEDGDEIVQLGNTTDTSRQNAIILDATALPRIDIYQGINSYSLEGKLKSRLGDLSEQGIQGMGIFTSQGRFTGQVVIGGGSTGYENFTDKPDLSLYPLKTYVDGAFKDGVISQAEASAIEKYKAQVNAAFNDTIATYNVIYANAYLEGTAKTDLLNAKVTMAGAKDNLITSIANAISDGNTTLSEKADVDAKYALWDSALSTYKSKQEAANKAIQQKLDAISKGYVDSVQIGGRNLIRYSKGEFTGSSQVYPFLIENPALSNVAGKTFTLSAEVRVTEAGNDTHVLLVANDASWLILNKSAQSSVNNTSWEDISVTFTVPYDFSGDVIIGAYNFPHANSGSVALRYLKLEEGNKATGWTPAPEDVAADINIAITAAAEAISAIEGMGEDGLITPFEKKTLRQMVNQMRQEFNELIGQADNYNVDSDIYNDSYGDLLSFVEPLLVDMSATINVDRTILEQLFSNYNTYKINLLNAISNAINGTATTALAQASAIFPSDANLLAHWSFDEVPEIPDGAYIYKSNQGWTTGVDGWGANTNPIIENGAIKSVGTNDDGAIIYRGWSESYRGKTLILKVKCLNKIDNVRMYNGSSVVDASSIVNIDDYCAIARFDNLQSTFGNLHLYINKLKTNSETAWIEWIYIGDCSYSSILKDNSGRNNTASLYGVNAHLGLSGKALNFSGSGYADLGNIGGQWEYTISFWFKKASLPAVPYETILGTTGGSAMEIEASTNGDGKINLYSWGGIKSPVYSLNAWHHVAISQNSSQVYLYMDGVQVASGATRIQLPAGMQLGRWMTSQHFSGSIDEFRLYNKALSASEILGIYKYISKGKAFAIDLEAKYLKEALKNDTSIEGGLVSTTLLKVGAVNQSGEYNENAGINGAGQGSNTPRIYSGGSLQDAIARVAGNTEKDMAIFTDGGKLFASAGEIAGFLMTQNGIEKEKSITEPDSTTFVGKFKLDWVNQIINFLRDGSSRVLISAKKLTSGIPTPTNFTIANGTWQNTVELNRNGLSLSHTSILGPRTLVAPGAYDAKETLSLRAYRSLYADTWLININFQVTLNIWKTDANNAKISLLSSSTQSVNLYSNTNVALVTANLTASLSIENETGLSHEVVLTGTMINPSEMPNITYSKVIYQTSLIYTASQESVEIGYSGLRILAQNLWFYFNTKDSENKHLRMRGNAALVSKNANTSVDLNDVSLTASRITLQGVIINLVNKTQNYTIGASDKGIAGIKVVNAAVNVVITFPDLNATDAEGNYYNDNRELTVVSTGRNVTVYPNSGQSVRNSTYVTINANCGYKFIGDRASGNWLFVGA